MPLSARIFARILACLALAAAAAPAHAQIGAGKVVHVIVPFAAGGVQDILARAISNELGQALGSNVIVENRPGAGGTIGTAMVAKAAPDGTTMILSAASHTINGSLYAKLPYDPIRDFTGMAHIGNASYVLIINAQVPAKNAAEYIRYAKANPGKLNYATAGNGSATHLSMAYFNGLAGIDVVHVPFKATGEAVNEVVVGRAQAVIAANIGAIPYVKDARVKLIGVTSAKRSKFLPEIPAIAESGLPGYEFDSWFGLLGPAGTPKATVDQVNAAMGKLLKDPVILERLAKQGIEPQAMTSDEFNRLLRADVEKMAKVVKASGARVD
ncbi:MAG: tripartite tricarboxylate transporter substrate binding protein [Proteobacteria bacterium]|nr:tripartite tricarboxylate transporter substrate binding protein [Pseudomonadota bacterium]